MKLNLRFLNKLYVDNKERKLKGLESKNAELVRNIENEEAEKLKIQEELNEAASVNMKLSLEYESYIAALWKKGIIMKIDNIFGNIKDWDNLYIEKKGSKYNITSKHTSAVYEIDENISKIIEAILKKDFLCSVLVIRVNNKSLKLKLSFYSKQKGL